MSDSMIAIKDLMKDFSSNREVKAKLKKISELVEGQEFAAAAILSEEASLQDTITEQVARADAIQQAYEDEKRRSAKLAKTEISLVAALAKERGDRRKLFETPEGHAQIVDTAAKIVDLHIQSVAQELDLETRNVGKEVDTAAALSAEANVDRLRRLDPLAMRLFDQLVILPTSTPARSDGAAEVAEQRTHLLRWLMVASYLSHKFPRWRSSFAYLMNDAISQQRHVGAATDLFMSLLPGSLSRREQLQREAAMLRMKLQSSPSFNLNQELIVACYDNIQAKHAKTTESGASYDSKTGGVHVRTMRTVLSFHNPEWAAYQRQYKHKPRVMAEAYPLSGVPLNAICFSATPMRENTDRMTDQEYLDAGFMFELEVAVEHVLRDGDLWRTECRSADLEQEIEAVIARSKIKKTCLKATGGCGGKNANRHGRCRGCGSKLLTMPTVQRMETIEAGEAKVMGRDTFEKAKRPYRRKTEGEKEAFASMSGADEGTQCTRTVLPMLDLNPADQTNQALIQDSFCELVGMGTHVGGAMTICLTADKGALSLKAILADEIERFWVIVGLGHAEMAVTRLCMKITVALFGDAFIFAHKFKEGTGGPDYLKSCKANRKAWQFIQLCNSSLQIEFVKQFFLAIIADGDQVKGELEDIASGVYDYLHEETADVMFMNLVFGSQILSAAKVYHNAMRGEGGHGNPFAQDAAMKMFIPLFYRLGFTNYGPFMHWSFIRNNYRCTPEMKAVFRAITVVKGQGLDFQIEEDIQRVMRDAKGKKEGKAQQQAAMNLDGRPQLMQLVNETLGNQH